MLKVKSMYFVCAAQVFEQQMLLGIALCDFTFCFVLCCEWNRCILCAQLRGLRATDAAWIALCDFTFCFVLCCEWNRCILCAQLRGLRATGAVGNSFVWFYFVLCCTWKMKWMHSACVAQSSASSSCSWCSPSWRNRRVKWSAPTASSPSVTSPSVSPTWLSLGPRISMAGKQSLVCMLFWCFSWGFCFVFCKQCLSLEKKGCAKV